MNHTALSTAYHCVGDTWMIGLAELYTYWSGVPVIGFSRGAPSIFGWNCAFARSILAVCGISAAMAPSSAWGVPGTEAFTFSFGLSSGMRAKSTGRSLPGTYCQGPVKPVALNQRPVTST